jgi:hypothetical protein
MSLLRSRLFLTLLSFVASGTMHAEDYVRTLEVPGTPLSSVNGGTIVFAQFGGGGGGPGGGGGGPGGGGGGGRPGGGASGVSPSVSPSVSPGVGTPVTRQPRGPGFPFSNDGVAVSPGGHQPRRQFVQPNASPLRAGLDPSDFIKQEAEPRTASGGIVGMAASDASTSSWNAVSSAIRASSLPESVKDRLTSPENVEFVARCQPFSQVLSQWRARIDNSLGDATSLDAAVESHTPSEKIAQAKIFRQYANNCLKSLSDIAHEGLREFVRTRLGVLLDREQQVVCMATAVTPRLLLTARHCIAATRDTRRDLAADIRFIRLGEPQVQLRLTGDTERSEYYASNPNLIFDANELHSDFVLFELVESITSSSSWSPTRIALPSRYDQLDVISFNRYAHFANMIENSRLNWSDPIRWDNSAPCMVVAIHSPRLLVHACQTEGAASGAPILRIDRDSKRVDIVGVHSGGFSRRMRHEEIWRQYRIDTMAVPNHGVIVDGSVKIRAAGN